MADKYCNRCAWWEPPEHKGFGFCLHGSINTWKWPEDVCGNWVGGSKKYKIGDEHRSYYKKVDLLATEALAEIRRLRAANAILVEALKEYTCKSWPWYTRDNQPSEECYAPWELAEEALKKTGHWE